MTEDRLTENQESCIALLSYLFEDEQRLLAELAPEGVDRSSLSGFLAYREDAPRKRWLSLLGDVAWEIFSNNNQVVSEAGKIYDLGSWRGSGGFIADFLNAHLVPEGRAWFDYIDFYCGLMQPDEEALRPLYVHFFERLKARGCTWQYSPPALYVIDFGKRPSDTPESSSYDPEAAVLEDLKRTEERQAKEDFKDEIDRGNAEMRARAVEHPPQIVLAYRDVYGEMPVYLDT